MIRTLLNWWRRFEQRLDRIQPRQARRVVVCVVGFTLLLLGLLMTVLPGPAFVVIPAGLAVLALEFAWARWLLHHSKRYAEMLRRRASRPSEPKREVLVQHTE
ncbi:MAG: PGPGW domain-containing protein [Chthoniobacteraceae bacterium]